MIYVYNKMRACDRYLLSGACLFVVLSVLMYHAIPTPAAHFDRDSAIYERIARNVYDHGELADPADAHTAPVQTVIYPLFLGLVYKLGGAHIHTIVVVHVLLSLISMWLVYRIAAMLFRKEIAAITVILYACNIGLLTYAQFVLAETLLTCVLMLFLERFVTYLTAHNLRALVHAGIALGCSIIIKPMALFYPFVLLPWIWWIDARRVKAMLVFLVASYAPVGIYMTRTYVKYNAFALAPMMSLNMYQCFLSKVIGRLEGRAAHDIAQTTLACTAHDALDEHGWDTARTLFYANVYEHPGTFVYVWLLNVSKTVFGLFSTQLKMLFAPCGTTHSFFASQGTMTMRMYQYVVGGTPYKALQCIAMLEAIWSLLRWLLVFVACGIFMRQRQYVLLMFFVMYCAQLAFVTGMDGCCRYRATFEPVLLMLAAVGVYALVRSPCNVLRKIEA